VVFLRKLGERVGFMQAHVGAGFCWHVGGVGLVFTGSDSAEHDSAAALARVSRVVATTVGPLPPSRASPRGSPALALGPAFTSVDVRPQQANRKQPRPVLTAACGLEGSASGTSSDSVSQIVALDAVAACAWPE
jgi:hypothetical protein